MLKFREFVMMTKAEELAQKEHLTSDDLDYIMTMNHSEYKEYSKKISQESGYIKHLRDKNEKL